MVLVHEHLLVRALVERPIDSYREACGWVGELVCLLGMRLLAPATGAYCDVPGNRGVTVLAPIETSHVALHIWDEQSPALVELDVFSCREVDPEIVMAHLSSMLPVQVQSRFLDRARDFADVVR